MHALAQPLNKSATVCDTALQLNAVLSLQQEVDRTRNTKGLQVFMPWYSVLRLAYHSAAVVFCMLSLLVASNAGTLRCMLKIQLSLSTSLDSKVVLCIGILF